MSLTLGLLCLGIALGCAYAFVVCVEAMMGGLLDEEDDDAV